MPANKAGQRRQARHERVFCQPDGKPLYPDSVRKPFNRAPRQAGLPARGVVEVGQRGVQFAANAVALGDSNPRLLERDSWPKGVTGEQCSAYVGHRAGLEADAHSGPRRRGWRLRPGP